MKIQITKFMCNNCKKVSEALIPDDKTGKIKFPYHAGWQYLYNVCFQTHSPSGVMRKEEKDKHFCTAKCSLEFIGKLVAPVEKKRKAKK